jgi:hypothetical protein
MFRPSESDRIVNAEPPSRSSAAAIAHEVYGAAARADEAAPFWTPSWAHVFRYLGWRTLLVLPSVAAAILLAWLLMQRWYWNASGPFAELLVAVALVPAPGFYWAVRRIVRRRKDPFCIHCGYTLLGLPDGHHCPECGRRFSLALVNEYRRDPHRFVRHWRARVPVLRASTLAATEVNGSAADGRSTPSQQRVRATSASLRPRA